MIPVKIECDCGQHYAFDVEPEDGRMNASVACPACGVDGTNAANAIIAAQLSSTTSAPPRVKTGGTLRINLAAPTANPAAQPAAALPKGAPSASQLGLVGREQAEIEARAKISWGDTPEAVIKYLMIQGFTHPEAAALVEEMFRERIAITRGNGIRKIVTGSGLVCVPVVAYFIFAHFGVIPVKLMAICVAVGLWGLWLILNGILLIVAPKMETGDVAEQ